MLAAIILGPTYLSAERDILEASKWATLLEIRIDLMEDLTLDQIQTLMRLSALPIILKGMRNWVELARLKPAFLDIDWREEGVSLSKLKELSPETQFILSYHNFEETPPDLETLYDQLKARGADFVKIATLAHSSLDALRLLRLNRDRLIAVPMGEKGRFGRIITPLVARPWTYALIRPNEALKGAGVMTYEELESLYHFSHLSPKTALFALIGSPVTPSRSHITHNALFRTLGLDALFVKIEIEEGELSEFFHHYVSLFQGLAVTCPLKERLFPFIKECEESARAIGAVNTIAHGRGANTDSFGALDAIEREKSVLGKKVAIIGYGGAARAIAHEAQRRGAQLIVSGRNFSKVERFAAEFGGEACPLFELGHYDILVNATSAGMGPQEAEMPLDAELIRPHTLVFDVVSYPPKTPFLEAASAKGCATIPGKEMFIRQALGQFQRWLSIDPQVAEPILRSCLKSEGIGS